jgi:hypothetical protein
MVSTSSWIVNSTTSRAFYNNLVKFINNSHLSPDINYNQYHTLQTLEILYKDSKL